MKLIAGATIGNCIHVAGVIHFMDIAKKEGLRDKFLGMALSADELLQKIEEIRPDIVAVGYRLTPENIAPVIEDIIEKSKKLNFSPKWVFGGTKPVADIAAKYGFFDFISDGYDDVGDAIRFFRGKSTDNAEISYGSDFIERLKNSYPYPLIRHHFGRPTMEETVEDIAKIAEAKVLDVISIGPDQNAQQYFFRQHLMNRDYDGAGGVPVRSEEDFCALKEATKCGNYPLMRCYSGTEDVFKYAKTLIKTIDNAWAAIPLSWYNELDGRGQRTLETSIKEAQGLIRWHGEQNIPVEINEPHHWGLRDAHDVIPAAMAYISALNAKKLGVTHYISQYMFNNPCGLSFSMDLAKILAMIEMVESLKDERFHIYRETRAGLALFRADADMAKGQLAAATFLQSHVKPHIVHVVGFSEADHAAKAEEVIESSKIARGVIRHTVGEDFGEYGEAVINRKNEIIREAKYLLDFICENYSDYESPLTNPEVLADAIKKGYIDAPKTINHRYLNEDVPNGLVPVESMGAALKVPTPAISLTIDMANAAMVKDYRGIGRKYEDLIVYL